MKAQKIWDATLDSRTRPNHGAMESKPANIKTGLFTFTTMKGSIIEVAGPHLTGTTDDINCRCVSTIQFDNIPRKIRKDNITKKNIPFKTYNEWYKDKYGKFPELPKIN